MFRIRSTCHIMHTGDGWHCFEDVCVSLAVKTRSALSCEERAGTDGLVAQSELNCRRASRKAVHF